MSKENVLVLPAMAQFSLTERGIEIVNDGDIILHAKFAGAVIRSLNGDVHIFSTEGEKQNLTSVEALNGKVKIVGEDFDIMEIRAKEIFADIKSLSSKVIRVDEEITINRGRVQANAVSANTLNFSGAEFNGQHIGIKETASFSCESMQVQVVTGSKLDFQLRNTLKIGKLTAHTEVFLSAKSIDIDYLSTKNLKVDPKTQGVIICLDGPAPTEPNSLVGLLSPAIFLEKIPSLTGLIRELQPTALEEKLLGSAVEDKKQFSINDVEVIEGKNNTENIQKSAFLERPPEFYRTSAEIPIPYRELAARQKIIETAKNGVEILEETPTFEPDLSPSGPIFEPDLAPSTPLFEPPGLIEPIFEPNKVEDKITENESKQVSFGIKNVTILSGDLSPLELPPLVAETDDPINSDTNPLNLTTDGIIDLGLDTSSTDK